MEKKTNNRLWRETVDVSDARSVSLGEFLRVSAFYGYRRD